MPVFRLNHKNIFPNPRLARSDGLLAVGGDLSPRRLLNAYKMGIFPWFSKGQRILWWSPDPRLVLFPENLHISHSLKKTINKHTFRVTRDTAFKSVITACSKVKRENQDSTWIVDEMITAYCRLHKAGFAHSVESWCGNDLVGGLYGISIGKCFFGESMFTLKSNASKVALVHLVEHLKAMSFKLIDCQVETEHLKSLGAKNISREKFLKVISTSGVHSEF